MTGLNDDDSMRLRVLFVDDDSALRRSVARAAVLHSVHVTTAGTEEEAWAALATQAIDVTVLDWHLDDGGQTSAELARELIEGGHLAIVWTADPERAREVVGDTIPVLAKSADLGALFVELARLVRQRVLELAQLMDAEPEGSSGSDGS